MSVSRNRELAALKGHITRAVQAARNRLDLLPSERRKLLEKATEYRWKLKIELAKDRIVPNHFEELRREAFDRGMRDFERGHTRQAQPKEYGPAIDEREAWLSGWDSAYADAPVRKFAFVVTGKNGQQGKWVGHGKTEREAWRQVWDSMTHAQQEAFIQYGRIG